MCLFLREPPNGGFRVGFPFKTHQQRVTQMGRGAPKKAGCGGFPFSFGMGERPGAADPYLSSSWASTQRGTAGIVGRLPNFERKPTRNNQPRNRGAETGTVFARHPQPFSEF